MKEKEEGRMISEACEFNLLWRMGNGRRRLKDLLSGTAQS